MMEVTSGKWLFVVKILNPILLDEKFHESQTKVFDKNHLLLLHQDHP
jgi:hypothetical protein